MARLTNFIYCLNAVKVQSPDGKGDSTNVEGILSALLPEYIPGAFSFSMVFTILGIDSLKTNTMRVVIEDDLKNVRVDTHDMNLPPIIDKNDIGLPNEYKGINASIDFRNVVFEKSGEHTTSVYLNGQLLSTNKIYVKGKKEL